jgi:hypothetical protein
MEALYPIIYALISLLIAFILFKYLKSSAMVKKTGYQAGGAIAGFIIVFSILMASYLKLKNSEVETKKDLLNNSKIPYTISGRVLKTDSDNHDGVRVTLYPPASKAITDPTGRFAIEGMRFSQVDIDSMDIIRLAIDVEGYTSNTLDVPKKKFHIRQYDKEIIIDTVINLIPKKKKAAVQPHMEILDDTL